MTYQQTATARAAAIIGRRVYGPFRETGGMPGERESFRLDKAARRYAYLRRVMGQGAAQALLDATGAASRDGWPAQWHGHSHGAGKAFQRNARGDWFRWIERPSGQGFRFIGWADELDRQDESGFYLNDDGLGGETARGCVYATASRNGGWNLFWGYREGSDSRKGWSDMSGEESAVLTGPVHVPFPAGEWKAYGLDYRGTYDATAREDVDDWVKDSGVAKWAHGEAESVAETSREHNRAYNAGTDYQTKGEELESIRESALALCVERKAAVAAGGADKFPAICQTLARDIGKAWEESRRLIAERAELVSDWTGLGQWRASEESAFRDGAALESA